MQSTTRPIALVLGANGRLGAAAVEAFAAAGWAVLAQARRPPAALPAGTMHVAAELADAAALARAAAGARVVVYAVNPLYTQWPTQALPLFRQGLDVAQRQAEPGIAIELVASDQLSNLLRREADIAVRMVRPA
ncbi:MAG TPA: NAD(P)H-binding protein, partial [Burkholderiaceae bacterium]|nr:NAD(P)H-binding protein [Burkholderiaceae bacterium]